MNLTVPDAARRLGVSPALVYAWCRLRLLAHFRFGRPGRRGKILVPADALADFAARSRVGPDPTGSAPDLKHIRL